VLRVFDDTARFATLNQNSTLSYSGLAGSIGVDWKPVEDLSVAASWRHGGTIRANLEDSLVSKGTVPDHYSAGLRYEGLEGIAIAAHGEKIEWSALGPLGTSALQAQDATNYGVGLEGLGPRFAGRALILRAGVDRRQLPFAIRGKSATETLYAFGLGAPFAQGRASIDAGISRASRSATIPASSTTPGAKVSESAWIMGLGLTVRY
jgi:hypothetical protein